MFFSASHFSSIIIKFFHLQIEIFCEAVPKAAEVCNDLFVFISLPFRNYDLVPLRRISWHFVPRVLMMGVYSIGKDIAIPERLFRLSEVKLCFWMLRSNIKSFMIQTGDPTGTGKGGQSIWGHQFADEIRSTIKV